MAQLILFGCLSIPVLVVSRKALLKPHSHGFYRFFSWECILWLLSRNYPYWFDNPWSVPQIISWILLLASIYAVLAGVLELKRKGRAGKSRTEESLYAFEKTTELVTSGIYGFIRHPLYASLLYLTWGIFLKNINGLLLIITLASSAFLFVTARKDEKEFTGYFGKAYTEYMNRSKMFIPFIV